MNATLLPHALGTSPLSLPASAAVKAKQRAISRNAAIALAAVALHVVFIWGLQSGLFVRAYEVIVPVQMLTQFVEPPAPKVEPVPPAPKVPPTPVAKAVAKTPVAVAPQPLAIADPSPSPNAPVGVVAPQAVQAAITTPVAAAPVAAAAPPAPPVVQLPSSNADYLQNPTPPYPKMSRTLNEQGKSVVNVLIGIDGLPKNPRISRSSGFDRLDQAALDTVMRWRFVPGKRDGVPEAMTFDVPINWVLN